nr:MAG: capsid protein [Parvo-like hybrid virus UC4]
MVAGPRGQGRQFARALALTFANPFTHLTRFIPTTEQVRPFDPKRKSVFDSLQGPQKKNKMSLRGSHVIPDDDDMDTDPPVVAAKSVASKGKAGSHETPVIPQQPHYGVPEVFTAVLPGTSYMSVACTNTTSPIVEFRLTSIVDRLVQTISTPTGSDPINPGLYNRILPVNNLSSWPASTVAFPSGTTDNLAWADYFTKMYNYYTVKGVEWEMTVQNANENSNAGAVIAIYYDTFSSVNAVNIHPPNAPIYQIENWPDVQWMTIPSSAQEDDNRIRTMKGTYYPGKEKTNVENDEDVKTWTPIGSVPALKENVSFKFFPDWKATVGPKLNIRFTFRYIVQFRDLKPAFRWPTGGQSAITLTAPTNIII